MALGLLNSWAFAQVQVRAGEHNGFSRIVVDFNGRVKFDLEKEGNSFVLRAGDGQNEYKIGNLTRRLSANRVKSVSSINGNLIIEVSCKCDAKQFWFEDRSLVIDFFSLPEEFETTDEKSLNQRRPVYDRYSTVAGVQLPYVIDNKSNRFSIDLNTYQVEESGPKDGINEDFAVNLDETFLEALLAHHRSTGIELSATLPSDGSMSSPGSVSRKTDQNIGFSTNAKVSAKERLEGGMKSDSCRSTFYLLGGFTENFEIEDIIALRSEVFDEFNRLSQPKAINLARAYLVNGMGAEALQTLSEMNISSRNQSVLEALSHLLEYGTAVQIPGVDEFLMCDDEMALWAFLFSQNSVMLEDNNFSALLREFNRLPGKLRQYLAADISVRLTALDRHDIAKQISSRASLSTKSTLPDVELARVPAMPDQEGDAEDKIGELRRIIQQNSDVSPLAMASLVKLKWEVGESIPLDDIDLLQAFAFESRGSDSEVQLVTSLAYAFARSGQFSHSFEALERLELISDADYHERVKSTIVSAAVRNSQDADFLLLALPEVSDGPLISDYMIMDSVERRLSQLGLLQLSDAHKSDFENTVGDRRSPLKELGVDQIDSETFADKIYSTAQANSNDIPILPSESQVSKDFLRMIEAPEEAVVEASLEVANALLSKSGETQDLISRYLSSFTFE
ncbi:hypothetical protein ACS3SW_12435 [Roseobacteraceae bacterium S113]